MHVELTQKKQINDEHISSSQFRISSCRIYILQTILKKWPFIQLFQYRNFKKNYKHSPFKTDLYSLINVCMTNFTVHTKQQTTKLQFKIKLSMLVEISRRTLVSEESLRSCFFFNKTVWPQVIIQTTLLILMKYLFLTFPPV